MIKADKVFATYLTAIYLALACFMAWNHELWVDEAYHYLLSNNSPSVFDIFANGGRSGHPVLWNLLLYLLKFFAPGIYSMQVFHVLIATTCVFVIACFSPFSRAAKVMLAFGYFFVYEYNVISKNYILGFSLIFIALVLSEKRKPLWIIVTLLGLAANTHLFCLFISVPLMIYLYKSHYAPYFLKPKLFLVLLFVSFLLSSVIQIIPPAEIIHQYMGYDEPSFWSLTRANRALSSLVKGLINVPDFRQLNFWNSNLIQNLSKSLFYWLSPLLLLLFYGYFKKEKTILILFVIPILSIMGFLYFTPLTVGVRYWGCYYVLFVLCTWLYTRKRPLKGVMNGFFMSIIGLQFLVSLPTLLKEYQLPFSQSKNAARYLRAVGLETYPVFCEKLALGPPLSAYSGKAVYYPSSKTFETYSYWIKLKEYVLMDFIKECASDMDLMDIDTCVVALQHSAGDSVIQVFQKKHVLSKLDVFDGAILRGENYYLYLLRKGAEE